MCPRIRSASPSNARAGRSLPSPRTLGTDAGRLLLLSTARPCSALTLRAEGSTYWYHTNGHRRTGWCCAAGNGATPHGHL